MSMSQIKRDTDRGRGHTERNCGNSRKLYQLGFWRSAAHGCVDIYFKIPITLQDERKAMKGEAGPVCNRAEVGNSGIIFQHCHVTL